MAVTLVFVATVAVLAIIDWWAVAHALRPLELFAKPATMATLVVVAAVAGDAPADVRGWLVAGAVFGLIGDVALLGAGDGAFMFGLAAFAIGHVAYAVSAVLVGFDPVWALPGSVFIVGLLGYRFLGRTVPSARRHRGSQLAAAVLLYAAVISAMVVTSWATSVWVAAAGAMLFAVSDWVLGYQRFVGPLAIGRLMTDRLAIDRLLVIVPYHVGQALLILGLATA